jgi:hypothetical protein
MIFKRDIYATPSQPNVTLSENHEVAGFLAFTGAA